MAVFQDTYANSDYISSFVSGQVSGGYLIGSGDGNNTVARWSASSTNLASNFTASSITGMAYTQEKSAASIGRLQFSSDGSNVKSADNSDIKVGTYYFDGVDDGISVPADSSIDNLPAGGGFTCSVWVYAISRGGNDEGQIFNKDSYDFYNWLYGWDSDNDKANLRFQARTDSSGWACTTTDGVIPLGEWTHICWKWDGNPANAVTLFINGVEAAAPRASGSGDLLSDAGLMWIGKSVGGASVRGWDGYISDMIWYASELTNDQMKAIFFEGNIPIGYAARWKLDGNANDESSNDNDGTVDGAVSTPTAKPDVGYLLDGGKLQSFDGSNDYVSIADSVGLAGTSAFSVSLWVMPTVAGGGTDGRPGIWGHYVHGTAGAGEVAYAGSSIWCTASKIGFGGRNGAGNYFGYFTTAAVLVKNEWLHIVCTYAADGVTYPLIYIDGTSRALSSWLGGSFRTALLNPTAQGTIGQARSFTDPEQQFEGYISNFAYYNKALSAAEVRGEYERGCPDTTDSNLLSYMPMQGEFANHAPTDNTNYITGAIANNGSAEIAFEQYRPVSGVAQKTIDVTGLSLTSSFYYNHVSTNQGLFGARLDEISLFYVAGGGGGGAANTNLIGAGDTLASNVAFSTVSGNAVIIDSRNKLNVSILSMNSAFDCALRKDTAGGDIVSYVPAGNTRLRASISVPDGTDVYLSGDSNTTISYCWTRSP